ncbi:MAG: hypothetical protein HY247_03095 [archaeon]|nr:MAG: hypothetical protein HY247_03095 [archaeon]
MQLRRGNKRRGVAELLSEVILIAITMISAAAVSGYFYTSLNSYQNAAQVSALVSSCNWMTGVCSLSLTNTGTIDTNVISGSGCASLDFSGVKVMASSCAATGGSIKSAKTTMVAANFGGPLSPIPHAGQRLTGSISLTNGAVLYFAGTF